MTEGRASSLLEAGGPLTLSLQVAFAALLLLLPPGVWVAWRLGVGRPFRGKSLVEALLTLPLVLPPTVVGLALLLLLGRTTAFGRWLNDTAHIRLLFTYQAAALAAALMAFPLFVRTAAAAFAAVDSDLLEAGRTLGATEGRLLAFVLVPLSYRGLLAGVSLAFARALGEFGATLMVAGSIPGRTQTLPLALYAAAQNGDNRQAIEYALILAALAWMLTLASGVYGSRLSVLRGEQRREA